MDRSLVKTVVVLLVVFGPFCFHCKPLGGKISDVIALNESQAIKENIKVNGSCYMLGLNNKSTVSIKGKISATEVSSVRLVAKLFKMKCANYLQLEKELGGTPCNHRGDFENSGYSDHRATAVINKTLQKGKDEEFHFAADMASYYIDGVPYIDPRLKPSGTKPAASNTTAAAAAAAAATTTAPAAPADPAAEVKTAKPSEATKTEAPKAVSETPPKTVAQSKREAKDTSDDSSQTAGAGDGKDTSNDQTAGAGKTEGGQKAGESGSDDAVDAVASNADSGVGKRPVVFTVGKFNMSESGVYLLQIYIEAVHNVTTSTPANITATLDIEMRNKYGLLSAIDYPALVFYGVMTSVYAILGITWIVMMLCSFNDLVRLQFWVMAVIILGFLEKTFFVAEYSAINLGSDTSGSFMVAEFVSAVKRGLSRMLLIIVAMGFGTVKPRLGDSLFKVVAAGVFYFALALIDGIMRARNDTFHTSDTSSVVTFALLLLLDTFIFYWIFISIVDTRRTLRLRKNYVKLAMYNHFAYTLIFAILATIGFIVWSFVVLEYPSGMCLTDWGEVWLRDCFWHVLFAFILLVVMWIWRPSSNRSRFAYSLVADNDDEEVVFEQGSNKNFDSVKMRSTGKHSPPPVSNQAEDDLRWVEENLPTTAMDKAIPLLVDSDEEVMTTKFEISKMN